MSLSRTRSTRHGGGRAARKPLTALVVSFALFGAAACSDDGGSDGSASSTAGGATTASASASETAADDALADVEEGGTVEPAAFLDAIAAAQEDAESYATSYTMSLGMGGTPMTIKGDGVVDQSDPAEPKVRMQLDFGGQAITMIVVGDAVYMQQSPGGKYTKMTAEQLEQTTGQDLSEMIDPQAQLEQSRDAITSVTYVGEEAVGGENARKFRVVMEPTQEMQTQAAGQQVPSEIPYDYWLNEDDRPVRMTMNMDLGQTTTSMDMTMSKYDEPVTVTEPDASQLIATP